MREWNGGRGGGPRPPTPAPDHWRPAWAEVDIDAVAHNLAVLKAVVAPSTVCAVVKADGYGHGDVEVARAAVAAGAAGLAVALVEEGARLRQAGIDDPILLLSEPPPGSEEQVVELSLEATVATMAAARRMADAARRVGARAAVHVKVDTGMHRVGIEPASALELVGELASAAPPLTVAGLWTHLAVAEDEGEEERRFTAAQLERFEAVRDELAARQLAPPILHAANSAGAIAHPASRYHMTRCGIALYGELPSPWVGASLARQAPGEELWPVLSLKARVSAVRDLPAGARPSYGRQRPLPAAARVATVPLGYADGVPRRLFSAGQEVLVGGRRRALGGMVTMDQLVVDCGDDHSVEVGDEVVLVGRQGEEEITVSEWSTSLGTIGYEVLTAIGRRVPRLVVSGGEVARSVPGAPSSERQAGRRRVSEWAREARLR